MATRLRYEYDCLLPSFLLIFFFFNDTATTEIYTLSLHDALPISVSRCAAGRTRPDGCNRRRSATSRSRDRRRCGTRRHPRLQDRKSTRLNSSHANISYAVFCLKKKKKQSTTSTTTI